MMFCFLLGYSQKEANIWMLSDFDVMLDFNSGAPIQYTIDRPINMTSNNSIICNSDGNTMFYSNGSVVMNGLNDTLLNGNLKAAILNSNNCYFPEAVNQGTLILPVPGTESKFYLFHECLNSQVNWYRPTELYYSVIDMNGDSGNGVVLQNETAVQILSDTLVSGYLQAVKHANEKDWWLVTHEYYSNRFYTFLVDSIGIHGPFEQVIGDSLIVDSGFGEAKFSQQGDKYVFTMSYTPTGGTTFGYSHLFDFDRCTGLFSNYHRILIPEASWGGAEFSPSGRFLYVAEYIYLYQYDLWSEDIDSSKILIADSTSFFQLQLAPDGKIYITHNGTNYISAIEHPDLIGLNCNFQRDIIALSNQTGSFPNLINYSIDPIPIFQALAGNDVTIEKGDTTIIGLPSFSSLIYSWQPYLNMSDPNIAQPFVFPDTATTYYLTITDPNGDSSCSVNQDSVTVFVTPKNKPELPLIIPTLLNISQTEFFEILNLPEGIHKLEIFNYLGQVIYVSENYLNDWQIKKVSAGLYLYRLTLASGEVMKGKIVVVR